MAGPTSGSRNPILLAAVFATLATVFWSGNWVMGRAVRADVPPLGLNFWRWTIATLILLPLAGRELLAQWGTVRRHWKVVVALGVLGATVFQSMVYIGLRSTEAVNALLLNATAPLFVIIIAFAAFRDAVSSRQLFGIAISFVGVAVLVARGDMDVLTDLSFNSGDAWILCALFLWGVYSVLLKRRPKDLGGVPLLLAISVVGACAQLPLYIYESLAVRTVTFDLPSVASLMYAGCFASVAAFLCYNAAIRRMGPNRTSFFLHLMPVFGSVMAIAFLGEKLHLYHLYGWGVVLAGVLVATTARTPKVNQPG